jgi:Ca2+-binding EF-hand superfamily protein
MADDEVTRTFEEFDGDGDGYITAAEFRLAMNGRREEVSSDDLDSIFQHTDDDEDGRINLAEFAEAWNA